MGLKTKEQVMHKISPTLRLIDLDLPLAGFRHFVSSWLWQKDGLTVLVDPGPSVTVPHLLRELQSAGVQKLDYILLTHIHIDHAGGVGRVAERFPDARICCHPKGIPHLIDPEKLWQGSLKVLGKLAETYGPILPVPANRLFFAAQIETAAGVMRAIETPGHAAHHLGFVLDNVLFAGEALGVSIPCGREFLQRVATPPRFKYEIHRRSVEILSRQNVRGICFAHYGYREDVQRVVQVAQSQLDLWVETIRLAVEKGSSPESVLRELLRIDPNLRCFADLPADIRERERYFMRNSIKGIWEYVQDQTGK